MLQCIFEQQGGQDCLAGWLTQPESEFPVSDDEDTWEYDYLVAAWQEFIETGSSGTDFFKSQYHSVEL